MSDDGEALAVPRPRKSTDFQVCFQGSSVEKNWNDCVAAARNAMGSAWDALTASPASENGRQYQLRGDDATRQYQGQALPQWEYKITDGGRLIYLIDSAPVLDNKGRQLFAGRVIVVEASPGHPKWTEKVRGGRKSPGRR